MRLKYEHYLAMRVHVAAEAPLEACGLVAGAAGTSTAVFPVTNVLHSPVRFRMAPDEQVRALLAIEAAGETLLAIYHSHPAGPPSPSPRDKAAAAYDVVYLVWSPVGAAWLVRAFRLAGQRWQEIPLRLT